MNAICFIARAVVVVAFGVVISVVWICDTIREAAAKRKLGKFYEGPLHDA